jgi:thiazole biosynthesis protein ThiH
MKQTFYDTIHNLSWQEVTDSIYAKTEADCQRALKKTHLDMEDFKALISPACEKFLEPMAVMSREITQRRFGKVMMFYVPLYLSNECSNHCIYCGFNHNNQITRKTLTDQEIMEEIKVIKSMNMDNLLLLTGEYPAKAGIDYIEHAVQLCRPYFSILSLEVYPMKVEEYARLAKAGVNAVYVYQETYNESRYKFYHPKGMKSHYEHRLSTPEHIAQAGIHKCGIGALIGLEDWRTEMYFTALHLRFMEKNYWRTKYCVSFPRMRPAAGGYQPSFVMDDKQFAQTLWAFRIFDHDLDITMSTREPKDIRDHFISLGITSISAGSRTEPGGYAHPNEATDQFHINDDRTELQMKEMVEQQGYEVIFKDWDSVLG